MIFNAKTILVLFLVLILGACREQPSSNENTEQLGSFEFKVDGKQEAMPAFERGFLFLHSFEYEQARDAFQEAQQLDSNLVMAFWGEAMTYNKSIWGNQDTEKAKEVLDRLGKTSEERGANVQNELERDFVYAVEALFYGDEDKKEREEVYRQRMKAMHEKHPEHLEVAAFYALSLLAVSDEHEADSLNLQVADIAKEILLQNPQHPGALHYLIHAYDRPELAQKALDAADQYAAVAPSAGHALHMPSHIYLAMGKWDKVVASNQRAWQASKERAEQSEEVKSFTFDFHSFHWLLYAYLQTEQYEKAHEILLQMADYAKQYPNPRSRSHLNYMKAHYLVHQGNLGEKTEDFVIDDSDLNIQLQGITAFIDGLSAFKAKDRQQLKSTIDGMKKARKLAKASTEITPTKSCGAINSYTAPASTKMIEHFQIMEVQLEAYLAWLEEDMPKAEEKCLAAIKMEDGLGYSQGTPSIMKPSHELYADFLSFNERYVDAVREYETALEMAPGRMLSSVGREQAMLKENR